MFNIQVQVYCVLELRCFISKSIKMPRFKATFIMVQINYYEIQDDKLDKNVLDIPVKPLDSLHTNEIMPSVNELFFFVNAKLTD